MGKERPIEELDGFWASRELGRTLHVGFEDEHTLYFDLFDSATAGTPGDRSRGLMAVLLDLESGEVRIERR